MKLADYLKKENICIIDSSKDTSHFYGECCQFLKEKGKIDDIRKVKRLFIKRESVQSTGIGKGVATPHIFSDEFADFFLVLAVIRQGLDFMSPDGRDVHVVFLIMSDDRDIGLHLKTLAHIARLASSSDIASSLKEAPDPSAVYNLILEKEKGILT